MFLNVVVIGLKTGGKKKMFEKLTGKKILILAQKKGLCIPLSAESFTYAKLIRCPPKQVPIKLFYNPKPGISPNTRLRCDCLSCRLTAEQTSLNPSRLAGLCLTKKLLTFTCPRSIQPPKAGIYRV